MSTLRGQVAVVTGTTSGIGRATATALVEAGTHVFGVARREVDASHQILDPNFIGGGSYTHVVGDASEPATARDVAGLALERHGRVDILVNNAGVGHYADFAESEIDLYDEIMGANMRSTYLFTRSVVPGMIEQGSGLVLQIASQAGIRGFAREAIYCASKHAQVGFTRALRLELGAHGIKVAVICPAAVKTDFARGRGRPYESMSDAEFLAPEDVADAVLFIATQAPSARTSELGLIALGESL